MNQVYRRERLTQWRGWVREFIFGAAMTWVMGPYTLKRRTELERMFMLMTASDLMGLPLSPPLTSLRLLPFMAPQILHWRWRLARWETELEGMDLKHLGH